MMSRFQLSLNVDDVEASVEFYTALFGVPPAKQRPGYANFVVADPPLKLVVIENEGEPGTINHVGVEFETSGQVADETSRLAGAGLPIEVDDPHTCCFATQEKAWTRDVDGVPWEMYTVTADTAGFGRSPRGGTPLDVMAPPVTLDELRAGLDDPDVVVVDAQGPCDDPRLRIPGAVDLDLDRLAESPAKVAAELGGTDRRVVLYCTDADCLGSEFAATLLADAGVTDLGRFVDGVAGWQNAGLPTESY